MHDIHGTEKWNKKMMWNLRFKGWQFALKFLKNLFQLCHFKRVFKMTERLCISFIIIFIMCILILATNQKLLICHLLGKSRIPAMSTCCRRWEVRVGWFELTRHQKPQPESSRGNPTSTSVRRGSTSFYYRSNTTRGSRVTQLPTFPRLPTEFFTTYTV